MFAFAFRYDVTIAIGIVIHAWRVMFKCLNRKCAAVPFDWCCCSVLVWFDVRALVLPIVAVTSFNLIGQAEATAISLDDAADVAWYLLLAGLLTGLPGCLLACLLAYVSRFLTRAATLWLSLVRASIVDTSESESHIVQWSEYSAYTPPPPPSSSSASSRFACACVSHSFIYSLIHSFIHSFALSFLVVLLRLQIAIAVLPTQITNTLKPTCAPVTRTGTLLCIHRPDPIQKDRTKYQTHRFTTIQADANRSRHTNWSNEEKTNEYKITLHTHWVGQCN